MLQLNGYSTAAFGKWHLTPDGQQGAAGPFDRWPNGWGFDYFWGFLGGEAGQWDPVITENNKTIGVPQGKDGKKYYFPDDMADKTIEWLHAVRAQDPAKPWFVYFSTGCAHAPHHVPEEWAAKYKGRFDGGWDAYREETFERQKRLGVIPADAKLTPRNPAFPAWDSLPEDQKALYARQMEVYAGYCENADWNVGRVIAAVEEMGELDNTLVIYIYGDNGASMEGTLTGSFNELTMQNGIPLTPEQQLALIEQYGGLDVWGSELVAPHYAAAWAWAGNCPFQWGKQVASHLGGTRQGMAVRYPALITDAGRAAHPVHPLHRHRPDHPGAGGPPAAHACRRDRAAADARHQLPAHLRRPGRRGAAHPAVLRDLRLPGDVQGRLVARPVDSRIPWDADPGRRCRSSRPECGSPTTTRWSCTTCPMTSPRRTTSRPSTRRRSGSCRSCSGPRREVQGPAAARRMSVFFGMLPPLPDQTTYTYYGDVQNVASGMIPRIYNHSYTITADLVIPEGGAEGVIVAEADHLGGFSLFVDDGKLRHTYSMMGVQVYRQESDTPLPTGEVTVRLEFHADAPEARHRRRRAGCSPTAARSARAAWTTPCRSGSPATRAWTSAATTAASSTATTRTRRRSRSPEPSRRSSSTSSRT